MTLDFPFTFPLAGGLHARPAAALRERALAFQARSEFVNDRSGRRAPLTSLLGLLATDTRRGDPCRILAEGPGAAAALADFAAFLPGPFLACDTPGEAAPGPGTAQGAGTAIAKILARSQGVCWTGQPIAPGVGVGPAVVARAAWTGQALPPAGGPGVERAALRRALDAVGRALVAGPRVAILEAQAAMLQDEGLVEAMEAGVAEGLGAPAAVVRALEAAQAVLRLAENPLLRERALDLRDLAERLLTELTGAAPAALDLPGPCVLVAAELTPSRLLALDRTLVLGLVLAGGSATSHTAILARSFGIPCVVGPARAVAGQRLLVDGDRGLVVPDPPPELEAYYAIQALERARQPEGSGATSDLVSIALHANILGAREALAAFQCGAQGIGLFRTEMLFLDRTEPPTQTEQYQAYREVLEAAGGRPVVLRLLDVGGDKPLPYLPLAREANPFLGRRGVRWYGLHPDVVKTQLRAAAAAAEHGDLRLMIPMVTERDEIRAVRALLAEVTPRPIPLGIMVEVPAAALNLAALSREADFLCVGTNDLVQYLFAADRGDAQVARPAHDWHPATLRILARIVEDAGETPLSLCGEMAGRPELLGLLVGLGLRSLSMAPGLLREARRTLAGLDTGACRALAQAALGAGSSEEVAALLRATSPRSEPLTAPDLVLLEAACATKEEAIKLLAERLAALGRARDPLAVEEAIWAREATYPTGVGFGFAVPHCKTAAVASASLAVLRLQAPVAWGGIDDLPVDCLVLLATSDQDGGQNHLRVFARLARKLMDPAFREALREARAPQEVLDLLQTHVLTPL